MQYRTILVGTFLFTVILDLTVAVEVGLVLACVFFIYRMSTLFTVEVDLSSTADTRVVRLYGALFFGAVGKIEGIAERLPAGTRAVVLQAHRLISLDTSGLDAIEQLHRVLSRQGIRLLVCELNEQPLSLLQRSGYAAQLGVENIWPDLGTALQAVREAPTPGSALPEPVRA